MEEEELFNELQALPRFALIRRLNDLIKRAKAVKVSRNENSEYDHRPSIHSIFKLSLLKTQQYAITKLKLI